MSSSLVHAGSVVLCAHGGQARPASLNPRVLVTGWHTVLLSTPWIITGCPLPVQPCVSAMWVNGTNRVRSSGQPLLVAASAGVCTPTGTPLTVASTQSRVRAV